MFSMGSATQTYIKHLARRGQALRSHVHARRPLSMSSNPVRRARGMPASDRFDLSFASGSGARMNGRLNECSLI